MAGGSRLAQYANAWLTFSHAERISNIEVMKQKMNSEKCMLISPNTETQAP